MSNPTVTNKRQLLLILAGVFLATLLYFAPRTEGETKVEVMHEEHEGHDHEEHSGEATEMAAEDVFERLTAAEKEKVEVLEERAEKTADIDTRLSLYDSLIEIGITRNVPPMVARYTEAKAQTVSTEVNWMLAGDNYFKAFRLSKQQSGELIKGAVRSYEKVLELNSENLSAQTALGVAYVEGASLLGAMPMKGIGILKEVLNKDPKNVDALTNLGYFAIQSGQYDKAVERFETVLSIDPENAEAYIYLTDIYLSQNEVDKGIETLEKYKSLVDDPLVKKQVDEYIEGIRNR